MSRVNKAGGYSKRVGDTKSVTSWRMVVTRWIRVCGKLCFRCLLIIQSRVKYLDQQHHTTISFFYNGGARTRRARAR
jgi:hypothetical protein